MICWAALSVLGAMIVYFGVRALILAVRMWRAFR